MLVLSRKVGQSIRILDDIYLEVIEIRGDKVRLGFVAPSSVPIHRSEIFEAIQRAKSPESATAPIQTDPVPSPSSEGSSQ